ncbi:MAG: tetratricopeptide repeat protein [Promethearchaeota archaeon]
MNERNSKEKPEEYFLTEKLIIEGKLDEALQMIDKFKEKGEYSPRDIILFNLLKCRILNQQGLWEDLSKLAEESYQQSLGLGENYLSIDALLKLAESLIWLTDTIRVEGIITQAEELLKSQSQESLEEYRLMEANIYVLRGFFSAWIKSEGDKGMEYLDRSIKIYEEVSAKIELVKPLLYKALILTTFKGELDNALMLGKRSLTLSKENNNKILTAFSLYIKGLTYFHKGDLDRCISIYEEAIIIFKELKNNYFTGLLLRDISGIYTTKGELDEALEYAELGRTFTEITHNQFQIAYSLEGLAVIYSVKGEIDNGILFYEKSLEIFKKVGNKFFMAQAFNNMSEIYRIAGDLEQALEYIELSIKLNKEIGNLSAVVNNYDFLIRILIDKGKLEQAWKALEELEQMKNQLNDEFSKLIYMISKAQLLKTSTRSRDRGKAEEIFKQIIETKKQNYVISIDALFNLCELLLTELSLTNDLDVLEEINHFTGQLLTIAEKSHSVFLFAEIYFLKAKLALLTLDMKTARRFLTQAQKIAERFGLNQLAIKISTEHENLIDHISIWEDLKDAEMSLTERIKLAGLNKHMKEVLQKSTIITAQIVEEKVSIHRERKICLICKGDVLGYIYICDCDAIYCENCARALTDLENACWVCGAPIDISKPIKPYVKEEIGEKVKTKKINKNKDKNNASN